MYKLLCVTPLFPSAEKPYYCIFLLQQLQALTKFGFDVSVLVPASSNKSSIKEEQYGGLRVIHIEYCNLKKSFQTAVNQDIERNQYDIISLNLCSQDLIDLFVHYRGIPSVVHFHGLNVWENYYEPHPLYAKFLKHRKTNIIRKADALIGVSDKVKQIASKHYPAERIYTVYNGVNPVLFYPRQRNKKSSFEIYCVANLIPIKGHGYLIKGLRDAKSALPDEDIKLHLVGSGPLKDELLRMCHDNHLENAVLFDGELKYEEIAERLGTGCDMFIMPSYFESLGCVYLEAMASGVLTAGVRGCGIDEIIQDGVNGILIEPRNSEQIADKIVWAVRNKDKANKIADEGRKTVLKDYTWEQSGKTLAETYERIINNYE